MQNSLVMTKHDQDETSDKELAKFTKFNQRDIASDEEILSSWSRMQRRSKECKKTEMKRWSQACGIDFSEHALLLSEKLRMQNLLQPASQYMHDYMHGLCSSGVMCWIIFLLVQQLYVDGVPDIWKQLHGFVQLWVQPSIHKCAVHRLFDTKAVESHRKALKFKSSASEVLALYHILAHYVQLCCLPHGLCVEACNCYLAWCNLLDYCVASCFSCT